MTEPYASHDASKIELMRRVGQNHIYTVYIRYFWLGNHQIYGVYIRIYTVLANPTNASLMAHNSLMFRAGIIHQDMTFMSHHV
jgi:hypothetical protein